MQVTALLPMKSHSGRVPNKNFALMNGKPLFEWILRTLINLDFVNSIVINTDARPQLSESELVRHPKVLIRDRPVDLRGDEVSMNLIIDNDLANSDSDHYLMTHTTNPAVSAKTLSEAHQKYLVGIEEDYDSLFSVNRYQTRFYRADASPVNHDPNNLIPTQSLEPWYEENSCYYFFSRQSFAATKARIGNHPLLHETPKMEALDIDEWDDWHLTELVLQRKGSA